MLSPYLCLFHGKDVAGFRRHCRQVISPIVIDVTILWSLCLSVCHVHASCSNGRRYQCISFAYDSPMSLQDRVKIWLTLVDPFLPKFCPKVTQPCWFNSSTTSLLLCTLNHAGCTKKPVLCQPATTLDWTWSQSDVATVWSSVINADSSPG